MRRLSILLRIALVAALPAATFAAEPAKGIPFVTGPFNEALARAKAEHKFLFLDAYASWCEPCKAMEREVYTDPNVAEYFAAKFVSIKVDMEKGEGPELAKRLRGIDGYPTLIFINPEGYAVKTLLGWRSATDFLAEARLVAK